MICISVLNNTNENHTIMRKTKSIRNILEAVRSGNRPLVCVPWSMIICFGIILLSGCRNNMIEFIPETFVVHSIDGYPISHLSVEIDRRNMCFYVMKKNGRKGSPHLRLDSIGDDYEIELHKGGIVSSERYYSIPIMPSEKYVITNFSEGDAGSCMIYVLIDKNLKVKKWGNWNQRDMD